MATDSGDSSPSKRVKRRLEIDPTLQRKINEGLAVLFEPLYAVGLLKLVSSNGGHSSSFIQASCETRRYHERFILPNFFQSGLKKIIHLQRDELSSLTDDDLSVLKKLLFVFSNSEDISRKLQMPCKEETAYVVQLAHHLLQPLSLFDTCKIDQQSRRPIFECYCCNEQVSLSYEDTSMGNEKVWHGSTDILMGDANEVSVRISMEEDQDYDENYSTSTFEINNSQLIAESIVFGFLCKKVQKCAQNHLIPTIQVSKEDVKVFFYDAKHDFLLESSPMPLFVENELTPSTLIALWLIINYPFTCSGLTKDIAGTGFNSDFLKDCSEYVQLKYRKKLRFGGCMKMANSEQLEFRNNLYRSICKREIGVPLEGCFETLSNEDCQYVLKEFSKVN